ncbi:hypothetical protein G881_02010 [Escherichia coli KOEGE 30 (63a)]|nr:hypothetical protein G881_02010 [Escherichia coli KOEGE 30 (63a)]
MNLWPVILRSIGDHNAVFNCNEIRVSANKPESSAVVEFCYNMVKVRSEESGVWLIKEGLGRQRTDCEGRQR